MRIELATRKLIKPLTRHLATFALVAGLMGVPVEASATKGDTGRGEARSPVMFPSTSFCA